MTDDSRRLVSRRTALLTLSGIAGGLAGCTGGDDDGGGDDGEETPTETATQTATQTATATETPQNEVPAEVTDWLSDVGNYDGTVADRTGQSEVTVETGAEGNTGNLAFGPPAIRIDTGTTVVWEWTGEGGQHNVVSESGGDFQSELVSEAGHTFEQAFESAGVVTYFCTPHRGIGMKGAIIVG